MKDFLGQELRVGDKIVMIGSYTNEGTYFEHATITKINNCMVNTSEGAKSPNKIIKIDTILNNIQNEN